jgi:hypothetical protein
MLGEFVNPCAQIAISSIESQQCANPGIRVGAVVDPSLAKDASVLWV